MKKIFTWAQWNQQLRHAEAEIAALEQDLRKQGYVNTIHDCWELPEENKMKLVKVISTWNEKNHPGKAGMIEAIVKLKDGTLATRHIYPADAEKAEQEKA